MFGSNTVNNFHFDIYSAGSLVNVVIPRPSPNGEPTPGVGKVKIYLQIS